MRLVFLGAAAVTALLWGLFYVHFMRLDCAARGTAENCALLLPWQLRGGPFYLLAGLPATIIIALLVLAWLTGRAPSDQNRLS